MSLYQKCLYKILQEPVHGLTKEEQFDKAAQATVNKYIVANYIAYKSIYSYMSLSRHEIFLLSQNCTVTANTYTDKF